MLYKIMFGGVCCTPSAFLNKNITTEIFMNEVMVTIANVINPSPVMTTMSESMFGETLLIVEEPCDADA